MLELHIIELGKVFSPEDSLADWVKIFNATTEEDLDMIKSNNIGIQTGIKTMREMSLTRRIRLEIEAREKARRDRVAEIEYIKDELREQGIKQGIAQGTGIINVLNQHLIQDNRLEDLRRSTTDSEFQKELIKEYNLK